MTPYAVDGRPRGRNWSSAELRVIGRYAQRVVTGRFKSVRGAVEDCRDALDRLRRAHARAPWAARPRSRVAVAQRLGAVVRSFGMARPEVQWGDAELKVVNRFAQAFIRGQYPELQLAARACHDALARARRDDSNGIRLFASRSGVAVRERMRTSVRKLGWRTSLRAWSKQEMKLLDGYARAFVRGTYATALDAAADYLRDIDRLRLKYPGVAWLASRHSRGSVAQRLCDRAHALGLPPGSVAWSRDETQLLDAYAYALIRREYPDAGVAARELARDMKKLGVNRGGAGAAKRRTYTAVHSMLWYRARELGRPFLSLPWSPGERLLADSYARKLGLGEFRNAWEAALCCARDLDRLRREHPGARWAQMRRTTLAVRAQIWQRADRLGLKWTDALWIPAEERIIDRYARDVVLGRYPSVSRAAPDCWRELEHFHRHRRLRRLKQRGEPGPRTLKAICGRLEARTKSARNRRK